ncbi:hypothetical protein GCM10020220_038250 [Nonomuraea rubra]
MAYGVSAGQRLHRRLQVVEPLGGGVLGGGPAAPHVERGGALAHERGGLRVRQGQGVVQRRGDVRDAGLELQAVEAGQGPLGEAGPRERRPGGGQPVGEHRTPIGC